MGEKVRRKGRRRAESFERCRRLMAGHFEDLSSAGSDPGRKVVWCSSVGPAELLRAMGFSVYFPENHGALLGATRRSADTIPAAVAQGYSPEICSYLTSDIGAFIKGETPLSFFYEGVKGVPAPDVLVYSTNQCRDVKDWFTWYSRRLSVPCIGVESFRNVDVSKPGHIAAVADQMRGLVPRLEQISARRFDLDELKEVVGLSKRCSDLFEKLLETLAESPSPLTFEDCTVLMGPAVVARGTQDAVDFYEFAAEEISALAGSGEGAVKEEKHRLYWEGMPVWGAIREIDRHLTQLGACIVASTYCNSWIFGDLDPCEPFESMARAYTDLFIVRSDSAKELYISRIIEKFGVHGIVFHDARTCPNNSNCRYGMPARLSESLGVPSLVVHGDVNDLRLFSKEQTFTKLEAFVEQLAEVER